MRVFLIIFVFSFFQLQSQTFTGNKNDISMIMENTKKFSEYVMNSDYKMIGESYTKDAKIFPNKSEILQGEDVVNYWKLPEGFNIIHHKIFQEEIKVVEDTAYDYGYYEGKTKNAQGEVSSWKGKYVIVWKKANGAWKMYLDIWNSVK
jgi:ketosteroid isomerase-like protein